MHKNFDLDLKDGLAGETLLHSILTGKKIEVKTDFRVSETGNIVIEFESRGKPSGIATTEADYWCIIFGGAHSFKQMVLIETERLKEIARDYFHDVRRGGDQNTSRMVVIPKEALL